MRQRYGLAMRGRWPIGAATGVGSLPGTDIDDAVRLVFGELPDFPHLPELPARGAGADLIGRAAAVLADLHVDLQPVGWRLLPGGAGAGMDERRATDFLARDLDALEAAAGQYTGPLKVQLAGPWTLAAALELPRGGPALGDRGAARDLTEALTEGLIEHIGAVQRRVPGAGILVQIDEPSLPAVLAGHIPTPSGFSVLEAVGPTEAEERLAGLFARVSAAGAAVGGHCCAIRPPLTLLRSAGADFLSFDVSRGTDSRVLDLDAVGEAVEAGTALLLGVVPATEQDGAILSDPSRTVEPARRLWRELGFVPERLGEVVAVSPTCGMAGASVPHARAALRAARAAARLLVDEPE
jgi:methionine synthase II (cobalamin-independent)